MAMAVKRCLHFSGHMETMTKHITASSVAMYVTINL